MNWPLLQLRSKRLSHCSYLTLMCLFCIHAYFDVKYYRTDLSKNNTLPFKIIPSTEPCLGPRSIYLVTLQFPDTVGILIINQVAIHILQR